VRSGAGGSLAVANSPELAAAQSEMMIFVCRWILGKRAKKRQTTPGAGLGFGSGCVFEKFRLLHNSPKKQCRQADPGRSWDSALRAFFYEA
jgi:hypothetical protein